MIPFEVYTLSEITEGSKNVLISILKVWINYQTYLIVAVPIIKTVQTKGLNQVDMIFWILVFGRGIHCRKGSNIEISKS